MSFQRSALTLGLISVSVALVLVLVSQGESQITPATPRIQVDFCLLGVPEAIRLANASFAVVYRCDVDSQGRISAVHKIRNEFVDENELLSCLMNWSLHGIESPEIVIRFEWTHAVGWTSLSMASDSFSQRIGLRGSCKGYARCEAGEYDYD